MNTISKLAATVAFAALAACGGSETDNTMDANMTADLNAGMTDMNAMDMNAGMTGDMNTDMNMGGAAMNADMNMSGSNMTGGNMDASANTGGNVTTNGM